MDETSLLSLLATDRSGDEIRDVQVSDVETIPEETTEEASPEDKVLKEFASLPDVAPGDEQAVSVKFHFPDGSERVKVFAKSGCVSMLFTFARNFQYPNRFSIVPVFPPQPLEDDDRAIESLGLGSQFVVHVVST
jgi:hypothetical protein